MRMRAPCSAAPRSRTRHSGAQRSHALLCSLVYLLTYEYRKHWARGRGRGRLGTTHGHRRGHRARTQPALPVPNEPFTSKTFSAGKALPVRKSESRWICLFSPPGCDLQGMSSILLSCGPLGRHQPQPLASRESADILVKQCLLMLLLFLTLLFMWLVIEQKTS